jgi:hypothetical protein
MTNKKLRRKEKLKGHDKLRMKEKKKTGIQNLEIKREIGDDLFKKERN